MSTIIRHPSSVFSLIPSKILNSDPSFLLQFFEIQRGEARHLFELVGKVGCAAVMELKGNLGQVEFFQNNHFLDALDFERD